MLHKKYCSGRIILDDMQRLHLQPSDLEQRGNSMDSEDLDQIPVKSGRELVVVKRQGARCYRLEKIKCGKKSCRCARGELHGPYWYAYYRENGRMRCEYIGKNLPVLVSLVSRAQNAQKESEAERQKSAAIVAELRETLKNLRSLDAPKGH